MNYLQLFNREHFPKLQQGGVFDFSALPELLNQGVSTTFLSSTTLHDMQIPNVMQEAAIQASPIDTSRLLSDTTPIDTASLASTASDRLSGNLPSSEQQVKGFMRGNRADRLAERRQARQEAFKENMQNLGDGLKNFVTSKEGLTMGANLATGAINALDQSFMGNKNFSSQSGAVDTVVHGASAALINSGNPIAMGVGVGLEALNFSSKANGDTVQGFDVNIDSSGYGNIGHMESKSNRDWGAMIGLGGLFGKGKIEKQLQQRNAQAQMALKAAAITDDIKFEQEARMSSVSHTLQNNAVALAGGVDTSVLAAKKGTKLSKLKDFHKEFVKKAKYGAKLKQVELSDTPNVLPVGAMHKELNHLDGELDITRKGIPVIQGVDDNAQTKEDIKEQADNMIQAAEIEAAEIIFNKEVTELLEDLRKKWNDSDRKDDELCYEAGLKIVKEILFNTIDEDAIIKGIKKNESSRD